ncbi:DUF1127 domain-containing protein [Pseudaminobacter sp. 19-2017]|uniref:DUF1127 domain-containing protein n=1 Tax=Pseudaminobacter soli (ex Zhang et al. 2022) TaxID=2831468 RepID=A0A942E3K1_9HYPH|nr:DUF1127 domain-containing protein [Pseudaminobacter soli]MBS3652342.1 DUF1127 domain-containing protein [Pseudaminobacter soli]
MTDHPILRPSTPARRDAKRSNPLTTLAQFLARAFQRWQQRKAIAHLEALDDRQLEDIGISRNDISRHVEDLFRRKGRQIRPKRSLAAPEEAPNELRRAA